MSITPTQVYQPQILKQYLERFEVFEIMERMTSFQVLPLGVLQVFFQLDHTVYHNTSFTKGWEKRPLTFIVGPYNRAYKMKVEGCVEMFSVKFLPGRYRYFFPFPVHHLKNQLISPTEVWGRAGEDLSDQISHANNNQKRCDILEAFLVKRLRNLPYSPIEDAARLLIKSSGIGKISVLAEVSNLSLSQFRNRFKNEMGLSPKEFQRIIRINALSNYAYRHPEMSFTKLAHKFHFHDQSHFIHDFSSITGKGPKKFFS